MSDNSRKSGQSRVLVVGVVLVCGMVTLGSVLGEGKEHVPIDAYAPHPAIMESQYVVTATDSVWVRGFTSGHGQ